MMNIENVHIEVEVFKINLIDNFLPVFVHELNLKVEFEQIEVNFILVRAQQDLICLGKRFLSLRPGILKLLYELFVLQDNFLKWLCLDNLSTAQINILFNVSETRWIVIRGIFLFPKDWLKECTIPLLELLKVLVLFARSVWINLHLFVIQPDLQSSQLLVHVWWAVTRSWEHRVG